MTPPLMTEGLQIVTMGAVATICASIAPIVLALGTNRKARRAADAAEKAAALVAINDEKTDKLLVKADEIHEVTNSAKSAVDERLSDANDRIVDLSKQLGELIQEQREQRQPKKKR